jgi:alkylated DNA repair dioxygenase AlkB
MNDIVETVIVSEKHQVNDNERVTSCSSDDDEEEEEEEESLVVLYENLIPSEMANSYLKDLTTTLNWKVEKDNFGRQTRQTCYYGDKGCIFSYVGLQLEPLEWTETLGRLRELVDSVVSKKIPNASCVSTNNRYLLTACLANHYPAGEGFIPWHYDEVRAHGALKVVASLSLGGPRRFQLRKRRNYSKQQHISAEDDDHHLVADILLPPGSVLLMKGNVQENYEHCLPLLKEYDGHRISLTFRSIVPGFESGQDIAQDRCCSESLTD